MKKHEIFFSIADIIAAVNEKHPHVLLPAFNPTKSSPSRPISLRSTGSNGTTVSSLSTKSIPSDSNKIIPDGNNITDGSSSPTPVVKGTATPSKGTAEDVHKFDLLCEKAFTNSFSHRFNFDHDDEEDEEEAEEEGGPKEMTEVGNFSVDEVDIADAVANLSIATAPLTEMSSVVAVEEELGSALLLDDKDLNTTPLVSTKMSAKDIIEDGIQRIKQLHFAVKEEIYKSLETRANDFKNGLNNNNTPVTPHTAVSNYTDSLIVSPIIATLAGYAAQNLEKYIAALDLYANATTLIDCKLLSQCILQFFIQSSSNKNNKTPSAAAAIPIPVHSNTDPTAPTSEHPANCPEIAFIISAYQKKSLFGMHAYRLLLEIVHTELKAQLGGQAIYLDSSLALGSFRKFAKSNNLIRNAHNSTSAR